MKAVPTRVLWLNSKGEQRIHSFGAPVTLSYARDWFRRSILECQPTAFMTIFERRESKLRLVDITGAITEGAT